MKASEIEQIARNILPADSPYFTNTLPTFDVRRRAIEAQQPTIPRAWAYFRSSTTWVPCSEEERLIFPNGRPDKFDSHYFRSTPSGLLAEQVAYLYGLQEMLALTRFNDPSYQP